MNWDEYFLNIADVVRTKSKDPSSTIGAVIAGRDNEIISTGYNGFPRGINEKIVTRWERPVKYDFVVHAETNAIYNAARVGVSTKGCTLYLIGMGPPTYPCKDCAKAIIQAGIKRVVGKPYKELPEHWVESLAFSATLFEEASVEYVEYSHGT